MSENYKKELISMVDELSLDTEFWEEMKNARNSGKEGKLGSTNIRSLASICTNADCYEEVKLYIEYKIGKGNGWNEIIKVKGDFKNKKMFGRAVIDHLENIYEMCNKDDSETLKQIALYFGYMFWRKVAIEKGDYSYKQKLQNRNGRD